LHPATLVAVRDELRRIQAGRGTDLELAFAQVLKPAQLAVSPIAPALKPVLPTGSSGSPAFTRGSWRLLECAWFTGAWTGSPGRGA
jgi:hypothetical protein